VGPSDLQSEKGFVPLVNDTMTKRAEEAMSLVLAKELEPDGVFLTIVYPGRASTTMTRAMTISSLACVPHLDPQGRRWQVCSEGCTVEYFAGTTDVIEGNAGTYIATNSQVAQLNPAVHDAGNQAKVMPALQG
jgi:NAD(P)-dependent dehydrogenase (short-subunit alcohol dehydrogenase family)